MSLNELQALHPAVQHLSPFFSFGHLPPALQKASRPFAELAEHIARGPQNPETAVALRKLLESKDAAVRARLVITPEETPIRARLVDPEVAP